MKIFKFVNRCTLYRIINFFAAHALRASPKLLPQARFAKTQLLELYIKNIPIKYRIYPKNAVFREAYPSLSRI